jgi:hypothetical protein
MKFLTDDPPHIYVPSFSLSLTGIELRRIFVWASAEYVEVYFNCGNMKLLYFILNFWDFWELSIVINVLSEIKCARKDTNTTWA